MNDAFLHRIRTEPPAHFAAALKERLDSAPRRRANALRLGLGLLLFGTAFAMVVPGVRHSIVSMFGGETVETGASVVVARGDESPHTPPTVTPPRENSTAGESSTQPARQRARESLRPVKPSALPRTVAPAIVTGGDESLDDEALDELSPAALLARGKTVTPDDLFSSANPPTPWPIVAADAKEAAALIETRRALFRVIARSYEPVGAMWRKPRELDRNVAALSAYRLLRLAMMIDDAYAIDARRWTDEEGTNALVWNQRVLFRKQIEKFSDSARALLEAAANGNEADIWRNADLVRRSCWQCHNEFTYRRDLPPRG